MCGGEDDSDRFFRWIGFNLNSRRPNLRKRKHADHGLVVRSAAPIAVIASTLSNALASEVRALSNAQRYLVPVLRVAFAVLGFDRHYI